jgi:hypothetical protein
MLTQGNALAPTEMDQKDCSTVHKTLGVMKAPNHSQTGKTARLTNKSNQHAAAILSNLVTHSDSLTTHQVYHLTSINYSLSVTYLTSKQCQCMQEYAVSAFLATHGYNCHFPWALMFAHKSHSGVGIVPFYLLQGQQCLCMLLWHTLYQTELGRQINIDLAWVQSLTHPSWKTLMRS